MNLIDILKEFDIEEILEFEEKYDKQFIALKKLYQKIRDRNLFLKLVLLNAINSYQLTMKGEQFWMKFSEYFSNKSNIKLPEDYIEFLKKYNKRYLQTKIKRALKLWNAIKDLDLTKFCEDLLKLRDFLSKVMNQGKDAKTIVFAVKMFGYACRIIKDQRIVFPKEIFIPLDSRLKKISDKKEFWIRVSEETGIPLLHVDSLIWITLGLSDKEIERIENKNLRGKIKRLKVAVLNSIS